MGERELGVTELSRRVHALERHSAGLDSKQVSIGSLLTAKVNAFGRPRDELWTLVEALGQDSGSAAAGRYDGYRGVLEIVKLLSVGGLIRDLLSIRRPDRIVVRTLCVDDLLHRFVG